jgi:glycosyltransferase involved in cell wall biosynthesis
MTKSKANGWIDLGNRQDVNMEPETSQLRVREISVFFPCFNEQANIGKLVLRTIQVLRTIADDFQIIIVDDGSQDNTGQIACRLAAENKQIELVSHPTNKGYGAALGTGFKTARKELVFYTDGDNQFDIGELPRLLKLKDEYDIVAGYRIKRRDSLLRRLNARLYSCALFLLFGLRIKDIDCAFKLYRREVFDKIDIKSKGALVDAEVLIKARRLGYRIGQCGVSHFPRTAGHPTGANIRVIFRAFKEIIRLRLGL